MVTENAPRNKSFFICDAPVDVLFANSEEDGKKAKVLEPSPSASCAKIRREEDTALL